MGPVALHGGGEFLPGDEPFLLALLDAVRETAEPVRVVLVPTAAARHDPAASTSLGTSAFLELAGRRDRPVLVETAPVIDAASAADPALAARIETADLIYLPGGDPSIIPALLPGTPVLRSIQAARGRGAVLAGASAGAMALGPFTWTSDGVVAGLGVVPGLVVFPHADAAAWARQTEWFRIAAAVGIGVLGLGEQTGIISTSLIPGGSANPWRVVGPAEARWLPPAATEPVVLVDGQTRELPG